ncbi:MAG: hypothetical protein AAGK32_12010, partial [Actinomycetota bacterium]
VGATHAADELRLREKAFEIARGTDSADLRNTADERLAFAPNRSTDSSSSLTGIIVPSPSTEATEPSFELLPPSTALMTLIAFPRVHGWTDAEVLRRDFDVFSHVVSEVPVWNATIPWGPPFRPEIATEILALLGWRSATGVRP